MLTVWVLISIAGLAVGAGLVALQRGRALPSAAIDGLTLGAVPALVLVRLIPHVYQELGVLSLGLVGAGFAAVALTDRHDEGRGATVGRALLVPALFLHAMTDGAALALASSTERHGSGGLLALSLVLHRLPEGLFLSSLLVPKFGWPRALIRIGLVALATAVGAYGGHGLLRVGPDRAVDGLVAVGLGAILRLVLHSHAPGVHTRATRAVAAMAFLLGLGLALGIPSPDSVLRRAQPRELSLVQSLGPLFIETAPSMLLGLTAVGLVHAFAPRRLSGWLTTPSRLSQAIRGVVFGLPLPLCSCGVLPLTRQLFAAGVPAAAVVGFAIGTPELGIDAALLSGRMLGVPLTVVRLGASVVIAIVVALLVSATIPAFRVRSPKSGLAKLKPARKSSDELAIDTSTRSVRHKIGLALRQAFGETLEHIAAWYVVGLLIAATFEAAVAPSLSAHLRSPLDIVVAAAAAIPVYVCAQGATPLAAVMIHKGFSVGAALTFLIVGPGTNIAVLAMIRESLGQKAAVVFAVSSIVLAMAAGLLANVLVSPASVPDMHPLVAHDHARIELVCAAVLGVLLVSSLVRLGPRRWFGAMTPSTHADH